MGLKAVIPLEIRNSQFSKFSGIADEMDCVFTVSIITRHEYDLVTREADAALCLTLLFQSVLRRANYHVISEGIGYRSSEVKRKRILSK